MRCALPVPQQASDDAEPCYPVTPRNCGVASLPAGVSCLLGLTAIVFDEADSPSDAGSPLLPPGLSALSRLQRLSLRTSPRYPPSVRNPGAPSLETTHAQAFACIATLTAVTHLDISRNKLESVPLALSSLRRLQVMWHRLLCMHAGMRLHTCWQQWPAAWNSGRLQLYSCSGAVSITLSTAQHADGCRCCCWHATGYATCRR